MIQCGNWPIGVCGWSLGNDIQVLTKLQTHSGIEHIHLALGPALRPNGQAYLKYISRHWHITATMIDFPQEDYSTLESIRLTGGIVPDDCWEQNKKRVLDSVELTASLAAKYLEFHFGFLEMTDLAYTAKLEKRVRLLADAAAKKNVILLMESGQETAQCLHEFLQKLNHPALAVNFDPGNMVLYGRSEPVEALRILGPWIRHIHIKDALKTNVAGTWGTEVRWGSGHVNAEAFLKTLHRIGYSNALAIEREASRSRFEDIEATAYALQKFWAIEID